MSAFPWTDEQKAVLASTNRITLDQAGPGSGKTKVFAELVDRRLKAWPHKTDGVAALSFTNVARAEIEDRVRASTVAPHFVGTLDAFFLRFVVITGRVERRQPCRLAHDVRDRLGFEFPRVSRRGTILATVEQFVRVLVREHDEFRRGRQI